MTIFKRIFASEKIEVVRCVYGCECGHEIYASDKDLSIMCPKCGNAMHAKSCQIQPAKPTK